MAAQMAIAAGSAIMANAFKSSTPFQVKAPKQEVIEKLISPVDASTPDVLLGVNKQDQKNKTKNTVSNLRKSQSNLFTRRGVL